MYMRTIQIMWKLCFSLERELDAWSNTYQEFSLIPKHGPRLDCMSMPQRHEIPTKECNEAWLPVSPPQSSAYKICKRRQFVLTSPTTTHPTSNNLCFFKSGRRVKVRMIASKQLAMIFALGESLHTFQENTDILKKCCSKNYRSIGLCGTGGKGP